MATYPSKRRFGRPSPKKLKVRINADLQATGELPYEMLWYLYLIYADFIRACCQVDPEKRPTSEELLNSAWLAHEVQLSKEDIGKEAREAIQNRPRRTDSLVESSRTRELNPNEREDSEYSLEEQKVCASSRCFWPDITLHTKLILA